MSDDTNPVPDDESDAQEHLHDAFKKLEEKIGDDPPEDVSREAFGDDS